MSELEEAELAGFFAPSQAQRLADIGRGIEAAEHAVLKQYRELEIREEDTGRKWRLIRIHVGEALKAIRALNPEDYLD
jgi:hypothetical protein